MHCLLRRSFEIRIVATIDLILIFLSLLCQVWQCRARLKVALIVPGDPVNDLSSFGGIW